MKIISVLGFIIAVVALVFSVMNYEAQKAPASGTVKLGFVRSGYVIDNLDITKEAREKLKQEQEKVGANLKQLEEKLAADHEAFLKEQEGLNRDDRLARIKSLSQQEEALNQYRANASVELGKKEQAVMGPAMEVVNARIAAFARREGYTLIWGTLSQGNILYGDPGNDITEAVVTALNEQK